jgi:uncharacterized protein (TIGR03083 family)
LAPGKSYLPNGCANSGAWVTGAVSSEEPDSLVVERETAVQAIEKEGALVVAILRQVPEEWAVPTCPGWSLERLGDHLGKVYAMASAALEMGAATEAPPPEARQQRTPGTEAAEWVEARLARLVDVLDSVDDDSPCWTFAYGDGTPRFWWRRQVHESLIHRVDAELAVLSSSQPEQFVGEGVGLSPVAADVGIDGVTEFLELLGHTEVDWEDLRLGEAATIHLHSTDPELQAEWTVDCDNRQFARAHLKADVALRGSAFALERWLWSRGSLRAAGPLDLSHEIEAFGDWQAAERWRPKR